MSKLKYSKKFRKESNSSNIQEELVKNKFDYNYNTKSKYNSNERSIAQK